MEISKITSVMAHVGADKNDTKYLRLGAYIWYVEKFFDEFHGNAWEPIPAHEAEDLEKAFNDYMLNNYHLGYT